MRRTAIAVVALAVAGGTLTAGILGAVVSVPLVAVAWAVFSRLRTLDPPMEADEADDEVRPQPDEPRAADADDEVDAR